MSDLISRSEAIKVLEQLRESNPHVDARSRSQHNSEISACIKRINTLPKVGEWIPFKLREADEEEKEAYGLMEMLCGELPEDGEEILVTYDNGYVGIDTFIWDGCECYLDSNREFCTEAIAWQKKPAPYDMRKKVE